MVTYRAINIDEIMSDNMSTITLNHKIDSIDNLYLVKDFILSKETQFTEIVIQNFILLKKYWGI